MIFTKNKDNDKLDNFYVNQSNDKKKDIRKSIVAGHFYESSFNELTKQIEACFFSSKGPGGLPLKRRTKNIIGVISPHAGYFFSGACAACSYKEIGESEFPDAYVILGPNHYNFQSGLSIKDWETPFGIIESDRETIKVIEKNTILKLNEEVHLFDHCIEVQLPFLQFVSYDRINDLKIIPISLGNDLNFYEIGKQLYNVFFNKVRNKKFVFIVSSDFTHYGRNYDYLPFRKDIKKNIYELDNSAIELIKNIDIEGFKNYLKKTEITICGYRPILVFLVILKLLKKNKINNNINTNLNFNNKIELLMHYTSGDIIDDFKNSVSYVSMSFR